jgi:hypothetical protein
METRIKKDFNGLDFKVNFGDFPPYCIIEDPELPKISGAMYDALKVATSHLNLTLIIQKPLPIHVHVFFSRGGGGQPYQGGGV